MYSSLGINNCFCLSLQNELKNELREKTSVYQTQLARLEQEKDELRIYKQDEVQSFKVTTSFQIGSSLNVFY